MGYIMWRVYELSHCGRFVAWKIASRRVALKPTRRLAASCPSIVVTSFFQFGQERTGVLDRAALVKRSVPREEALRLLVKTLLYTLQLSLAETNDPLPSSETA
jgi:hypothetical protein